ncbi:hypothetical protein AQUCO_02600344v1 [Aquilegia coerulea]|uniref:Neprosin PEP catalytic domain-containing protein n=1 Tax=Aquilegia coerulea TaxID=218851 RepID=A0A2G5D8I1_AQUCA|nr:hypothetical protein AQUCO_02600344v1 [Aquilegia coerulea]
MSSKDMMNMAVCYVVLLFLVLGGAECRCSINSQGDCIRERSPRVSAAEDENLIHLYDIGRFTSIADTMMGFEGVFTIWKPNITEPNQAITNQMWIVHENDLNQTFTDNAIEAGWMVDEKRYGDNELRFFVKTTISGYQNSCYNDEHCEPKFYKERDNLFEPITNISNSDGHLVLRNLTILQDEELRRWVVYIDDEEVGHWNMDAFTILNDRLPNTVEMGGKVVAPHGARSLPLISLCLPKSRDHHLMIRGRVDRRSEAFKDANEVNFEIVNTYTDALYQSL